ncbi:hypothetical protein LINPERPRIM_LOCUS1656 [Linum perenne]
MWRFATERGAWWRNLIVLKYGVGASEWCPNRGSGPMGGSMWLRIIQFGSGFWRHAFIDPGGGFCSFWKDYWVEGERLSDHFPRVEAAIARSAGSRVCDFFSCDRAGWVIPLRFELRDGARTELQRLLTRLAALPPAHFSEGPDYVVAGGS